MTMDIGELDGASPGGLARAEFRQFARAVTGDQMVGDAIITAIRDHLGEKDEATLAHGEAEPYFAAALGAWRTLAHKSAPPFGSAALAALTEGWKNQALHAGILHDVMGLSTERTAALLGCEKTEVLRLLEDTRSARSEALGRSVLIVEDDPLIAERLGGVAEKMGATAVHVANDGAAALQAVASAPADLMIADYDLSGPMTGIDVMRAISAEHETICLFVTGYPRDVLTGADDEPAFVIPKPFREEVVAAALAYAARIRPPVTMAP